MLALALAPRGPTTETSCPAGPSPRPTTQHRNAPKQPTQDLAHDTWGFFSPSILLLAPAQAPRGLHGPQPSTETAYPWASFPKQPTHGLLFPKYTPGSLLLSGGDCALKPPGLVHGPQPSTETHRNRLRPTTQHLPMGLPFPKYTPGFLQQ